MTLITAGESLSSQFPHLPNPHVKGNSNLPGGCYSPRSAASAGAHFLPSAEGTGCSAALWEAERCFAELWSKVLFPFFSSAQIPGAVEGQDLFERHHVAFAEGQQHFLGHSVPLLSDHMHFLLCVSCLGSSNDTQALDTRRGWCFIFPPCSSAILLFVFFLIRVRVN